MNHYAVINVKTDPEIKQRAVDVANQLGVSLNAILNNELKRLITEERVVFETPEQPNPKTAAILAASRKKINAGDYHRFSDNKKALDFLARELK